MVASPRVQILTDKAQELDVLYQYIKNPKLIEELKKDVVDLNTLTEEQSARYHEAHLLMQKKDRLEAEIAAQQRQIEKEKADHDLEIKNSQAQIERMLAEANDKVQQAHDELDLRKVELDEYSTRLDQRERKLKEQAALIKGIIKD